MTSERNGDTLGGPDRSDREDELAGPRPTDSDVMGGADPGPEDELAVPGADHAGGPDTLGGPDPGDEPEDELRGS